MRTGRLENRTTGETLSARAFRADSWFSRLQGWIGRRPDPRTAIGITQCDWVHTFLVYFPLDLIYCDRGGVVLQVVPHLAPRRLGPRVPGAEVVWEMLAGELASRVTPGNVVLWSPGPPVSRGEPRSEE